MKRLVLGILAHVDAGKTTLSEGILYSSGKIRRRGRVDHGDAYLDNNSIERERGITVFSKQAVFSCGETEFTLLDTPGHIDFAAEAERTLWVLDCAVLVISASDGVQAHTETLWKMLKRHNVPVFIFVNKMDLPDTDTEKIMKELTEKLDGGCLNFNSDITSESFADAAAMCDEELMDEFLTTGSISQKSLAAAISRRSIFPCFFGSALKMQGIDRLLSALDEYTVSPNFPSEFGAKVFKISDDGRGKRLTYIKVTGGELSVKDMPVDNSEEKVNEIRIYSGEKYTNVPKAESGMICAAVGLTTPVCGAGLGFESDADALMSEPVFGYRVIINDGTELHTVLSCLKKLEEEETQLRVSVDANGDINVQLMGEIQLEVIQRIIKDRFGTDVSFEKCGVIYRETIAEKIEGVGHYEPLRHYAEVHLLLEPLPRGSGVKFASRCSEDMLDKAKQRLVLTHLEEKTHIGVLTGSPICDIKITLISGAAHVKHTEGGDFRQATYRAVRQGLMRAKSVLLEPWYSFKLEIPSDSVGRAMTDIDRMGGRISPPEINGDSAVISGFASVAKISDYSAEVTAYTRGKGRLICRISGYEPCADSDEVIQKIGYCADADVENTADSIFCSHGGGYTVKWNEVFEHMHIPAVELDEPVVRQAEPTARRRMVSFADDNELMRIFEKTYGKIERKAHNAARTPQRALSASRIYKGKPQVKQGRFVLVDGYNVIFAWDDLKKIAADDLDLARITLINRLCAYRAMRDTEVIAVFDAYKVKGGTGSIEKVNNISVVYTKEAETADSYIEKATQKLSRHNNVRVVTSDYMEQLIILGNGAYRVPAGEFLGEVKAAEEEIREYLAQDL